MNIELMDEAADLAASVRETVNVSAIVEARLGPLGVKYADWLIEGAKQIGASMARDGTDDSLRAEIAALRNDLRRVCCDFERAVMPEVRAAEKNAPASVLPKPLTGADMADLAWNTLTAGTRFVAGGPYRSHSKG